MHCALPAAALADSGDICRNNASENAERRHALPFLFFRFFPVATPLVEIWFRPGAALCLPDAVCPRFSTILRTLQRHLDGLPKTVRLAAGKIVRGRVRASLEEKYFIIFQYITTKY
jgi:hypothetical protein